MLSDHVGGGNTGIASIIAWHRCSYHRLCHHDYNGTMAFVTLIVRVTIIALERRLYSCIYVKINKDLVNVLVIRRMYVSLLLL